MISKELAKAVLSGEYKKAIYSDGEVLACTVNKHELMHLCKEWMYTVRYKSSGKVYEDNNIHYTNNTYVESGKSESVVERWYRAIEKPKQDHKYYCRVTELDNSGQHRMFTANTEFEAVTQACEAILKEIDDK